MDRLELSSYSLSSLEMDNKLSLLCDEELLISPPPCRLPPPPLPSFYLTRRMDCSLDMHILSSLYPSREDRDRALGVCMERETTHMPQHRYVDHLLLSTHLVDVRFRVVQWMIKVTLIN